MISLEDKTITLDKEPVKLIGFEVWFRTPLGITRDLDHGIERCRQYEWDIKLTIVPVVVAVGENGIYEEVSLK